MRLSTFALGATLLAGTSWAALAQDMTDAQIQQKLQADGYTNIGTLKREKGHIDATATKNGQTVKLAIDPKTGAAMPDTDKDDDD